MFETMICSSSFGTIVTNDLFDLLHVAFGQLDARSGRRFQIDDELTGIRAREKRNAQKGIERECQKGNSRESDQRRDRFQQSGTQSPIVFAEHFFEVGVKSVGDEPESRTNGALSHFFVRLVAF